MKNNSNRFLALLAGGAIGAVLSILYAPDKGLKTRRKIADKAERTKDYLLENAEELKKKAKMNYHQKKSSLDSTIESIVSDASYKADDFIMSLEEKLEELRMKKSIAEKIMGVLASFMGLVKMMGLP